MKIFLDRIPMRHLAAEREAAAVEIAGKLFTPDEAREIDEQIDKLDALMRQRRERVLAAMAAEQCSCSLCLLKRCKVSADPRKRSPYSDDAEQFCPVCGDEHIAPICNDDFPEPGDLREWA